MYKHIFLKQEKKNHLKECLVCPALLKMAGKKISEDVALWNLICAKSTEHNLSRNKEQYTRERRKKNTLKLKIIFKPAHM